MGNDINKIYQGDTLEVLRTFPDNFVDTIVTSPPYHGLRNYGEETKIIWDGDKNCEHNWKTETTKRPNASGGKTDYAKQKLAIKGTENYSEFVDYHKRETKSDFCSKCGAWYGQLGLEPTLDLYLEHLLQITAELKRVLKPSGVMFWNHGDCYGGSGCGSHDYRDETSTGILRKRDREKYQNKPVPQLNLTPKCLALQNYRLILKMIDEQGWILRNTIVWHKPNHMPSSVRDRFTNSYEPVFMLVKNKKYWFDLDAVRIPSVEPENQRPRIGNRITSPKVKASKGEVEIHKEGFQYQGKWKDNKKYMNKLQQRINNARANGIPHDQALNNPNGKNPGDVWRIPTQPFRGAHFATFPEKLVEPMIKSGCPEFICKKCGKARERIIKRERPNTYNPSSQDPRNKGRGFMSHHRPLKEIFRDVGTSKTIGWTDCGCNAGWEGGIVLDPFMGSGTTAVVARKLGRNYLGIELNPEYIKIAEKRLQQETLL